MNVTSTEILKTLPSFDTQQHVIFSVADHKFGLNTKYVTDIILKHQITKIPLAPKNILGSINLRGEIVTAIDLPLILTVNSHYNTTNNFGIIIAHNNFLYCLAVDIIHNVSNLKVEYIEPISNQLQDNLKEISSEIYAEPDNYFVLLDKDKICEKYL